MISRQVFLCRMNLITNMSYKSSPSAFTIIVAFVCLALAGLAFLPLLPVKLSPSRTLPRLSVSFNMPGNSSRVIEMEVTSRLEAMLSRISGVKEISSTSGNGWGRITIELDNVYPAQSIDIDFGKPEVATWGVLEVSTDGKEWKKIDYKQEKNRLTADLQKAPVKAVRFSNSQDKEQEIYLRRFVITVDK